MLQSRCASESKRPPVQCCFDRGGIEVDPVPRCARPAPPTTPSNPAPRRPHQPQPKLRNWRRRPAGGAARAANVAGKISQKNSLKRTLEKEIGEAPPSRLERIGLLAERVARLRLARAREKFAPLRETPPLSADASEPLREREQAPPSSVLFRSGWYRSRPRTSLRSPGAADHTIESGAAAAAPAPTQTQELATAASRRRRGSVRLRVARRKSLKRTL